MTRTVKVATYNCEWRNSQSSDAARIRELVSGADVVCLTEAYRDFFLGEGHTIETRPRRGSASEQNGRRGVLLWSRHPWEQIDSEGPTPVTRGRFVAAKTATPIGLISFIGVVIPYRFCDVPEVRVWQRHLEYIEALDGCLPGSPERLVVLGDFNQRVPRKYQSHRAFEELDRVVLSRMQLATGGIIEELGKLSIDHVCHSDDLKTTERMGLSNERQGGGQISDHFGVEIHLMDAR